MNHKQTKAGDDDDCAGEPFFLMAKPLGIEYTVNIDETFVHPRQFQYIVHAMDNATEMDQFTLNLTTVGGALHAVMPLLGAMDSTAAQVHVHACSDVASAGTFLLMKAHSISMNEYATVMCHNVSFGSGGSGWNVEKHVEHTLKSSKRLLRDVYKHFFNPQELDLMLTGTDFYMDREEFIERYTKRADIMEQEVMEKIAAFEAEQAGEKPPKPRKKPLGKKHLDVAATT